MAVKLSQDQQHTIVTEWQTRVRGLLDEVEGWARSQGWQVERTPTEIHEEGLPEYGTEILDIHVRDETRVYLEPIARYTFNGKGVVELYGWPSVNRVRLQPENGADRSWIVMTDSGIPLRGDWNCENFVTLVNDLVAR